jgi:hypothetical protein
VPFRSFIRLSFSDLRRSIANLFIAKMYILHRHRFSASLCSWFHSPSSPSVRLLIIYLHSRRVAMTTHPNICGSEEQLMRLTSSLSFQNSSRSNAGENLTAGAGDRDGGFRVGGHPFRAAIYLIILPSCKGGQVDPMPILPPPDRPQVLYRITTAQSYHVFHSCHGR